ncbi:tyrosinase precursor (monophenol monooxygenase) [Fusarium heterosporum]|uniref:tyrosinase n=1 Tax=Fusarium heterosporum TaxID=42747 RepID=A0A8H5WV73_FUSHE|nr:tyrosinase precursor (monophenol monooxygenase) [Fusarium heterosporum]
MHLLIAWLLILVGVAAQNYNYGIDTDSLIRRQDGDSRILVKPLPQSRNGTIPLRPEIREMKADRYKWDLYILSMSMFQDVSQDDPASWYQIAGIHGVPFEPWNGVEAAPGANQSGYCAHNSVLFPMWHRPYLALFEQELYRMANVIAGMFPNGTDRQPYLDAARDFRMPYWNWATASPPGESFFPDVFWNSTISQNGPRGVQEIRNPLYSYKFHPKNATALIWTPLRDWGETKRGPNSSVSSPEPTSDNEEVNSVLLSKLPQLRERLFVLFSNYKDFNSFGNKAWAVSQNLSALDSIESVHDIIHIYGGLRGHMTYVPLSSFDPLFLLHHTMTDRLVAIWQAMNPDSWLVPMPAGENSFTTLKGDMQDSQSPLTPFLASDDGTFWTSDTSRTTEAFGYAYNDTDLTGKQKEDVRQELVRKISEWWESPDVASVQSTSSVMLSGGGRATRRYTEWIANVRVNVEALDGRFGIHFFLGEPSSNWKEWDRGDESNGNQNHVGTVAIFTMNRNSGSDVMISGTVPLTSALIQRGIEPEDVESYLGEHLQFRVLGSGVVDPSEVTGLYIDVTSSDVKIDVDSDIM